jgi:streptogramin lyase
VLPETTVVINPPPIETGQGAGGDGAAEASARSTAPTGIAVDAAGNLYVTQRNKSIRKITPDGVVSILPGHADGIAPHVRMNSSLTVAADSAGNLHVTDATNCSIRKITPAGRVTTTTLPGQLSEPACPAMQAVQGQAPGTATLRK